jgi:hypothetical protein
MTDTTQGADAPDDHALFNEATSQQTLEKFENPELPEVKPEPKPEAKPEVKPAGEVKPEAKPEDNAPVPAGRLREESEARRRAERERDELMRRIDAMSRPAPQTPQQAQQKEIDLFENPKGFVQQELKPYLDHIEAKHRKTVEDISENFAMRQHGAETVNAAKQALEQGMAHRDPDAWSTYNRAMASNDPYGVIVSAHRNSEAMRTIGGDLEAYKKRIIDEAMADPEYQKRVMETVRGSASAAGNNVARPVRPQVSSSLSLGNIGAAGGDAQVQEASDIDLFRAATTAKRR